VRRLRTRDLLRQTLVFALIALAGGYALSADDVKMTEIAPSVLLFSTANGNVVASVGPDGALLIGTPSASSTDQIAKVLSSRTQSMSRYVVIAAQDAAHSQGDAGWTRRGAFVAMQENALGRLGGGGMGKPKPLPAQFNVLRVERPRIAFSEVIKFDMNGDAIHIVHQKPGYSDADCIAHFHSAKLIYLGEVFPGDGYPKVDAEQDGALDGFLSTLEPWTMGDMRFVPARGGLVSTADVKAFHDMIATVRDRVQAMLKAGKTESAIVAAHPTAEFDARSGHGRVTPEAFVREVYAAVKKK
jgi:cyclase